MTVWARLTWQAEDPAALAAELAHRLRVPVRPGGLAPGARLLSLGTAVLEVRPWIREGSDDRPRAAGRLMLEPVPDGEPSPVPGAGNPMLLVGLGWATVELDRAEAELDMWLGPRLAGPGGGVGAGGPAGTGDGGVGAGQWEDESLGAWARVRGEGGLPGSWTVLLEPATEGRVAASLARDGEGPCALYLWPTVGLDPWLGEAAGRGVTTGVLREGPFGPQVLLTGSPSGPHVILVSGSSPVSGDAPLSGPATAGTIAP
jgi:hypothetical protein